MEAYPFFLSSYPPALLSYRMKFNWIPYSLSVSHGLWLLDLENSPSLNQFLLLNPYECYKCKFLCQFPKRLPLTIWVRWESMLGTPITFCAIKTSISLCVFIHLIVSILYACSSDCNFWKNKNTWEELKIDPRWIN